MKSPIYFSLWLGRKRLYVERLPESGEFPIDEHGSVVAVRPNRSNMVGICDYFGSDYVRVDEFACTCPQYDHTYRAIRMTIGEYAFAAFSSLDAAEAWDPLLMDWQPSASRVGTKIASL